MAEDLVLQGVVNWSGKHWINYIREPGFEADTGMVSLYNMRYTEVGHGFVAFVVINGNGENGNGESGFKGLCTDNIDLVDFVIDRVVAHATHPPYNQKLLVFAAGFTQGGHIARDPCWTITTEQHMIVAPWCKIQPVVIATGPWLGSDSCNYVSSLLHFTDEAEIQLDGRVVPGKPYRRDIWRETIGGDRSSCVFALSESLMTIVS